MKKAKGTTFGFSEISKSKGYYLVFYRNITKKRYYLVYWHVNVWFNYVSKT